MRDIVEIKKMYLSQYQRDGLFESEIEDIEKSLGISLPNDFKAIANFFSGGRVGIIEFFDFRRSNPLNIIDETIRLRNSVGLSHNFVLLSEENESIVLLDLVNQPSIIWCDSIEINKAITRVFENEPDYWNDFSDLFFDMLNEEI